MANPIKGEVSFDDASGKTYTLQYSINALVQIEDVLDLDLITVASRLVGRVRLGVLRAVLWGGLQAHHREVTLSEAGDLIESVGPADLSDKVRDAFFKAFPKAKDEEGAGGDAGPRKQARGTGGTGKPSSASGSSST